MQGASAIQSLLKEVRNPNLRVLVIWEPVLLDDWSAPSGGVLSRIQDSRAAQFWDPGHLVSERLRQAKPASLSNGLRWPQKGEIIWDLVALYPPGATTPSLAGGPVVEVIPQLRQSLANLPR